MTSVETLDRAFSSVMRSMVASPTAPHYTELAADLGVLPDEGKVILGDLIDRIPGWLHPGTD
ncbi:MAG: hypothetical protein ACI8TP_002188 [Acidimicrobiales bacterium]|jgi:hypothetical protein